MSLRRQRRRLHIDSGPTATGDRRIVTVISRLLPLPAACYLPAARSSEFRWQARLPACGGASRSAPRPVGESVVDGQLHSPRRSGASRLVGQLPVGLCEPTDDDGQLLDMSRALVCSVLRNTNDASLSAIAAAADQLERQLLVCSARQLRGNQDERTDGHDSQAAERIARRRPRADIGEHLSKSRRRAAKLAARKFCLNWPTYTLLLLLRGTLEKSQCQCETSCSSCWLPRFPSDARQPNRSEVNWTRSAPPTDKISQRQQTAACLLLCSAGRCR